MKEYSDTKDDLETKKGSCRDKLLKSIINSNQNANNRRNKEKI